MAYSSVADEITPNIHLTNNNIEGSGCEPEELCKLTWQSNSKVSWNTQKLLC